MAVWPTTGCAGSLKSMVMTPPTAQAGLVHQAAGLIEEDILSILADLGDLDLVELLHVIVVVLSPRRMAPIRPQRLRNWTDWSPQHVAGGVAVKAAHLAAFWHPRCPWRRRESAREECSASRLRDEVGDIDVVNFVKAQGLDADDIFLIGETTATISRLTEAGQHKAPSTTSPNTASTKPASCCVPVTFPLQRWPCQ